MLISGSCSKDPGVDRLQPENDQLKVTLKAAPMSTIITRATDTSNRERNERSAVQIRAYIFDGQTKTYKFDHAYDYIAATQFIYENPINLPLYGIANGDEIVYVANYPTELADHDPLVVGESKIEDLNDFLLFSKTSPITNFNREGNDAGQGMPLFGKVTYHTGDTQLTVNLIRGVAKLDVQIDVGDKDVTGLFTDKNTDLSYQVCNVWDGLQFVPNDDGTVAQVPADAKFFKPSYDSGAANGVYGNKVMDKWYYPIGTQAQVDPSQLAIYLPEFNAATTACGTAVKSSFSASTWNKDRFCIILKAAENQYYRVDLARDGLYLDLTRNTHYQLRITGVEGKGYPTAQLAYSNPPANLKYTFTIYNEGGLPVQKLQDNMMMALSNDGFFVAGPADGESAGEDDYVVTNAYGLWTTANMDGMPNGISLHNVEGEATLVTTDFKFENNQSKPIQVKFNNKTQNYLGYLCLQLGNIVDTVVIRKFALEIPYDGESPSEYVLRGKYVSYLSDYEYNKPDNFNTSLSFTNSETGSSMTISAPVSQLETTYTGYMYGEWREIYITGETATANVTKLNIKKPGASYNDLVISENSTAQKAYLYLSNADNDNNYTGNGWADDPTWNPANHKDIDVEVFRFKTKKAVTFTAPDSENFLVTSSSIGVDAWKGKTGAEIAAAGNSALKLPVGTTVSLCINIRPFEWEETFTLADDETMVTYPLLIHRTGKVSYIGGDLISGFEKLVSSETVNLGSGYGTGDVLNVSVAGTQKKITTNTNPVATANATIASSEKDLGYRAGKAIVEDKFGVRSMYYVAQTGLGFAGAGSYIRIARINGTGTWVYFVPSSQSDIDKLFVNWITNTLVFMIGTADGLEVSEGHVPWGKKWNDLRGDQAHSWSPYDRSSIMAPNWDKNDYGLYGYEEFPYEGFEIGGTESPCPWVYPKGAWRAPTDEEVQSWTSPVNGIKSKYPIVESYEKGIKLQMANGQILYIDAPGIFYNGVYGGSTTSMYKGIVLGPHYYIYGTGQSGEHHVYPSYYEMGDATQRNPAANVANGYSSRDAVTVLCIRE